MDDIKTRDDNTTIPPSEAVAVKLLEDLDLTGIPDEQKQQLLERIATLVDQEIMYAVMSRLEDTDVDELETLLAKQNGEFNEETVKFLETKIPNLGHVIEETMVSVYDRLKETNDILAS